MTFRHDYDIPTEPRTQDAMREEAAAIGRDWLERDGNRPLFAPYCATIIVRHSGEGRRADVIIRDFETFWDGLESAGVIGKTDGIAQIGCVRFRTPIGDVRPNVTLEIVGY